MKAFGWVYIILFGITAVLTLVTALAPGVVAISLVTGVLSIVVVILGIVVFILSCIGKLLPRKVFLVLPGYSFLKIAFGIILGIMLVMKVGAEKVMSGGVTPELLTKTFPWFGSATWILNILFILLAVFGIIGYLKPTGSAEQPVSND